MKTNELTGAALDWAVAKSKGFDVYHSAMLNGHIMHGFWVSGHYPGDLNSWVPLATWNPSESWGYGGPILNNAKISRTIDDTGLWIAYNAYNYAEEKQWMHCDRSELVAGLRCFVESQLGDEVDVPKELV